ncbi:hypothetical protein M747DRAFT_40707 [Aspergillus niger ATCC 13496]|uniref:Uncharacterized protein n=1 Tax=Aspergillus niger ATCC 13496 TaxID=1353008 RepID=A0A370C0R0_ASPNG|nr:hypothetical protein M747DRAFT_40707 [Aspergillus niger ATCC 13496]
MDHISAVLEHSDLTIASLMSSLGMNSAMRCEAACDGCLHLRKHDFGVYSPASHILISKVRSCRHGHEAIGSQPIQEQALLFP